LLQVGDFKIASPEDVLNAAFFVTSTEPLAVRISRNGEEHQFTVIPLDPQDGSMPAVKALHDTFLGSAGDERKINLNK
jgi:hypothetical protein